jgi:hypothetical protein
MDGGVGELDVRLRSSWIETALGILSAETVGASDEDVSTDLIPLFVVGFRQRRRNHSPPCPQRPGRTAGTRGDSSTFESPRSSLVSGMSAESVREVPVATVPLPSDRFLAGVSSFGLPALKGGEDGLNQP